jgi:hypothetical protein
VARLQVRHWEISGWRVHRGGAASGLRRDAASPLRLPAGALASKNALQASPSAEAPFRHRPPEYPTAHMIPARRANHPSRSRHRQARAGSAFFRASGRGAAGLTQPRRFIDPLTSCLRSWAVGGDACRPLSAMLVVVALAAPLHAQSPAIPATVDLPPRVGITGPPRPLTLDEAIRLTLEGNNDVTIARLELRAAREGVRAARESSSRGCSPRSRTSARRRRARRRLGGR